MSTTDALEDNIEVAILHRARQFYGPHVTACDLEEVVGSLATRWWLRILSYDDVLVQIDGDTPTQAHEKTIVYLDELLGSFGH